MPELSNSFQAGKMNKDADERLVSGGEYRNALNIQVTTSEGSHVGTAQSVLGNRQITSLLSGTLHTVGHLVDEKVDRILRMVAKPYVQNSYMGADYIMEYNSVGDVEKPVAVDIYKVSVTTSTAATGATTFAVSLGSAPSSLIAVGMKFRMETSGGVAVPGYDAQDRLVVKSFNGSNSIVIEREGGGTIGPNTLAGVSTNGNVVFLERERYLEFSLDVVTRKAMGLVMITGINLIDDLLFWTDNANEPKKINIKSAKLGTYNVMKHSELFVKDQTQAGGFINSNSFIAKDHVTVIRKGPNLPPKIDAWSSTNIDDGSGGDEQPLSAVECTTNMLFASWIGGSNQQWTAQSGQPAHQFSFVDNEGLTNYSVGEKLKFSTVYNDPITGAYLESEAFGTIRAGGANAPVYTLDLDSITTNQPVSPPNPSQANYFVYEVTLVLPEPMFEFKFPRFSTRWKYSDGEYSVFGPFTEVAFVPDVFDYLPKKGYNLGMSNDIRYIEIGDWVPQNLPKDVVGIDLLYKESNSPNVYTIESFKPSDDIPPGQPANPWNTKSVSSVLINDPVTSLVTDYIANYPYSGSFRVTSELINKTVKSNQLLRPWDNVPRVAMAQEMTGNRLVYANYLQNYDLISYNGYNIDKPQFLIDIVKDITAVPKIPKLSLKSMRTYQVGIVYRDRFGRETPILTSESGTKLIEKVRAKDANSLEVEIKSYPPAWADTYKIFVKETSNEYYNLAMDRWYNAKDGNIWLSFPSSERNKVSDDTFLILKKEHNNDNPVDDDAKYRILSIESNAPDYIKTENQSWGSLVPFPSFIDSGTPYQGRQNLDIDYVQWERSAFDNMSSVDSDGLQIRIRKAIGALESKWYDVTNIGDVDLGAIQTKRLTVKGSFGEDMLFTSNDGGTTMVQGLVIDIRQRKVVNSAQFDGRFFVKILKDAIIEKRLQSGWGSAATPLIPLFAKKISYMRYCSPGDANANQYDTWNQYSNSNKYMGNGDDGNGGAFDYGGNLNGNSDVPWNLQGTRRHTNYAEVYSVPRKDGEGYIENVIHKNMDSAATGYFNYVIHGAQVTGDSVTAARGNFDSRVLQGQWSGNNTHNPKTTNQKFTNAEQTAGHWKTGHYLDYYMKDMIGVSNIFASNCLSGGVYDATSKGMISMYLPQQPMLCPRASRWGCQNGSQNSPGPWVGKWTDGSAGSGPNGTPYFRYKNAPIWAPADAANGPFYGEGSSYVRNTSTGSTTWGSNFAGGPNDVTWENNPVGGMLLKWNNTGQNRSGANTTGADAFGVGAIGLEYHGLGTFSGASWKFGMTYNNSANQKSPGQNMFTELLSNGKDPNKWTHNANFTDFPSKYWQNTVAGGAFTQGDGSQYPFHGGTFNTANQNRTDFTGLRIFSEEIRGATGYYGPGTLRSQWAASTDQSNIFTYPIPYEGLNAQDSYEMHLSGIGPTGGIAFDANNNPIPSLNGGSGGPKGQNTYWGSKLMGYDTKDTNSNDTTGILWPSQAGFVNTWTYDSREKYPPTGQNWYKYAPTNSYVNGGTSWYNPPSNSSGEVGTSANANGFMEDGLNAGAPLEMDVVSTILSHNIVLPEPDYEVPMIFREKQYPLLFPRKSLMHPTRQWWEDWWEAEGNFRSIAKPTELNVFGSQGRPVDDPGKRWIIDHVGAAQDKSGAGIWDHSWHGSQYMDISFIGVGDNSRGNTIWDLSETPSELGFADALNTPGTQFRFREDHNGTVYTIVNSALNTEGDPGQFTDPSKEEFEYGPNPMQENPRILNYTSNPSDGRYDSQLNRRIRWRIELDRAIGDSAGADAPFYHPINRAVDPGLVERAGTILTNPKYNPHGRTTGTIGEVYGRTYATTSSTASSATFTGGDQSNSLVIEFEGALELPGLDITDLSVTGFTSGTATTVVPGTLTSNTATGLQGNIHWSYGVKVRSWSHVDGTFTVNSSTATTLVVQGDNTGLPVGAQYTGTNHFTGGVPDLNGSAFPLVTAVTVAAGQTTITIDQAQGAAKQPVAGDLVTFGNLRVEFNKAVTTAQTTRMEFATAESDILCYEFPWAGNGNGITDSAGNGTTAYRPPTPNRPPFEISNSTEFWDGNAYISGVTISNSRNPKITGITALAHNASALDGVTPSGTTLKTGRQYWDAGFQTYTSNVRSWRTVNSTASPTDPCRYAGRTGLNEWGLNYQTIEILTTFETSGNETDLPMSPNPAIWETEPREDVGLDLYYEASEAYPVWVDSDGYKDTVENYLKLGSKIYSQAGVLYGQIINILGDEVEIMPGVAPNPALAPNTVLRAEYTRTKTDAGNVNAPEIREFKVLYAVAANWSKIYVKGDVHTQMKHTLNYHNCYSFGNGVESNRIRDDYNAVTIDKGVKVSMPLATPYEEERRTSGLIFSGIYNSTSGVNELNQFIQAEPITKDLNPVYGPIRKLFSRNTDLVTFCEDKVFKILANKDALFGADGNTNVTATNRVLGSTMPFSGEYGMSHRESFAFDSYRSYFVDANRGKVIRLSRDGMTPISDYGMQDFFFDHLKLYNRIVGSYDDRKSLYNLHFITASDALRYQARPVGNDNSSDNNHHGEGKRTANWDASMIDMSTKDPTTKAQGGEVLPDFTISYSEDTRGWVSFKSFVPERADGFNATYYTFKGGQIWRHHDETSTMGSVSAATTNSNACVLTGVATNLIAGMVVKTPTTVGDALVPIDLYVTNVSGVNVTFSQAVSLKAGDKLTFTAPRNFFYGIQYYSSLTTLFNGGPDIIKGFSTMKYEGTQAHIRLNNDNNTDTFWDNKAKLGWYVDSIVTDQQSGRIPEFIPKEGKWFNKIIGNNAVSKNPLSITGANFDTRHFALQGIDYSNTKDGDTATATPHRLVVALVDALNNSMYDSLPYTVGVLDASYNVNDTTSPYSYITSNLAAATTASNGGSIPNSYTFYIHPTSTSYVEAKMFSVAGGTTAQTSSPFTYNKPGGGWSPAWNIGSTHSDLITKVVISNTQSKVTGSNRVKVQVTLANGWVQGNQDWGFLIPINGRGVVIAGNGREVDAGYGSVDVNSDIKITIRTPKTDGRINLEDYDG